VARPSMPADQYGPPASISLTETITTLPLATQPRVGTTINIAIPVPQPHVEVRLFGRIEATIDGRPIRLAGRQAQALLALLVLRPRPRPREALAADLWPDGGTSSFASLRQSLWLLRSALSNGGIEPERVLETDQETLGLQEGAALDTDIARFEAAMNARPQRAEEAVIRYRGELAEALPHECFAAERERLSDVYEDALSIVAERRAGTGNLDGARRAAQELLCRDPLREDAHAILMSIYGTAGSRSQVVRQYRRLRDILRRELGVEPLPETMAAYDAAMGKTARRSQRCAVSGLFGFEAATTTISSLPLALVGDAN
jgi:DNA-binding SARP family transcriptional activator